MPLPPGTILLPTTMRVVIDAPDGRTTFAARPDVMPQWDVPAVQRFERGELAAGELLASFFGGFVREWSPAWVEEAARALASHVRDVVAHAADGHRRELSVCFEREGAHG
jgi:hypothetical protein